MIQRRRRIKTRFQTKSYSTRHTYSELASNSEYCGYLGILNFERKFFWSLTLSGGLCGPEVTKIYFEIEQKSHLPACISMYWLRIFQLDITKIPYRQIRTKIKLNWNQSIFWFLISQIHQIQLVLMRNSLSICNSPCSFRIWET